MRFCKIVSTGLVGKIIAANGASATVQLFRSPEEFTVAEVPAGALQPYDPPPQTRCYVRRGGGEWFTGRTGKAVDSGIEVLSEEGREYFDAERVFLKSDFKNNPAEILALFGHDKPSRHKLRRAFVLSVLNQRKACRGLTALLPARVRLYRHQVHVVRRVLQDPALRYVLADEVGLGKTIEAGLIAKQYLLDHPGRRLLVLAPTALEGQWQEELERKIGLPPASFQVQSFEEFFSEPSLGRPSLAILDEAHQLVTGATSLDRTLRKRFEVVRSLCMRTESLLLLTATPVLNHERDFLAMLHLVAPQQFRLDDEDSFNQKLALRQEVGHILLSLDDKADPYEIELNARSIGNKLPRDQIAQAHASALLDLATLDPIDQDRFRAEVRRTRAYLNEAYRLSRRLVRTRRESLSSNDILPRTQVIRLALTLHDESSYAASIVDLLETWRDWSLGKIAADDSLRTVHETVFRLFWAAFSMSAVLLRTLIDVRLRRESTSRISGEIAPSEIAQLAADATDTQEIEILDRLSQSLRDSDIDARRDAQIAGICRRHPRGKGVIFISSASACRAVHRGLAAVLGSAMVECLHRELESWDADEKIDRFLNSSECLVLVCDRSGEEGRNLQLADYAVFVDLPFDPFRIEQRCGRFDRIGQSKSVEITMLAGPRDQTSIPAAWAQMLCDGFRVFTEPISSLQFYSDQATTHLIDRAYNDGAQGLVGAIPEVRLQLESERRRIREQDILDADEPDNGVSETINAIVKIEADANDLKNQTHPWVETALRFEAHCHSDSNRMRYSFTASTLADKDRFAHAGLEEYEATYDRRDRSDLPLLRVGDPFIEALAIGAKQDDLGRSFAFWRQEKNWDTEFGGDWAGFRIELLIEGDIEQMLRAAERHCFPINEAVLHRRIETWFPSTMRYLFLDTAMRKVDPTSSLFRVLNRQYTKQNNGGTDARFRGNFQRALFELGVTADWPSLCKSAHTRAISLLADMPKLQAEITVSAQRAQRYADTVLEQLRFQADSSYLAYEEDATKGLVDGIRAPSVRLDSIGFIVVSSRPAPLLGKVN